MTIARTIGRGALGSPLEIPGCTLWLDASDSSTVTLVDSKVSQWNDKSGLGRNASQSDSAKRPTYGDTQNGRSVITFSSASLRTTSAVWFPSSRGTCFFAVKPDFATGYGNLFDTLAPLGGSLNTYYFIIEPAISGTNYIYAYRMGNDLVANNPISSSAQVMTLVRDGDTTLKYYNNGALNTAFDVAGLNYLPSEAQADIGRGQAAKIAEILFYGSALPAATRIRIENYLRAKWGTG